MTASLVLIVLAAALLHAMWNAMAKGGGAPELSIASYQLFGGLVCAALIPFVPYPKVESWPYLAASVLIHNAYYFTLSSAYRAGDLSQVYPLFRGLAPVLVAIGAAVFVGEWLSFGAAVGIGLISLGIISLAFAGGRFGQMSATARNWGLATSFLIACYTVTDGIGVRLAGSQASYIVWLFTFEVIPIGIYLLATQPGRWFEQLKSRALMNVAGGVASSAAYGLVIYAMSFGLLAAVSSIRETSVIFAAVIGVLWLKEPFGRARIIAACLVAIGIGLIRYLG
ncbi:MAG: DMT family transporter [Burkholderiaceae bacterium]